MALKKKETKVMRSRLLIALVVGAGLLVPQWASADDEADKIKNAIDTYLSDASGIEDAEVGYQDLTVTPNGAVYDVKLNGLKVSEKKGVQVDLGDYAFSVEPKDGDYVIGDVVIPSKISFSHDGESETADLAWTVKAISGTWSPLLEEFKALNAEMTDVTVTVNEGGPSDKQMVISMGDMAIKINTDEESPTSWNNQGLMSLGPLHAEDPEGDGVIDIGKILIEVSVDKLNPQNYLEQMQAFTALASAHEANDEAKVQELKEKITALGAVADGFTQSVTVSDVSFKDSGPDGVVFKQKQAMLLVSASAPAAESSARMNLSFNGGGLEYSGEDLHGEDQLAAMLAPTDWELELKLLKLPKKETTDAIMEVVFATIGVQREPNFAFPQIMMAMGQAGSEIVLETLALDGPLASLDGVAKATVDPTSAMGAVGGGTLTLSGLEKVEAALGDLPKGMQQEIGGALVFLKGLGSPETKDGGVVYTYVFDLPADGNLTLNGQPMGALLGN